MKKKFLVFPILAELFLSAVPVFAEGTAVYNFEGKASLRRDNTVYQLDYDLPCKPNDILRSDKDGFVDLTMKLFAGARLQGAGECLLVKTESNNRSIKLNYGAILVNLKPLPPDGSYEIETPIMIASVSSSQFTPNPKNNLFLVEHVKPKDGDPYSVAITRVGNLSILMKETSTTITMLEGQIVEVPEHAFAPTARNASEENLERLAKANSIYITED